jgi:hypothetical protein
MPRLRRAPGAPRDSDTIPPEASIGQFTRARELRRYARAHKLAYPELTAWICWFEIKKRHLLETGEEPILPGFPRVPTELREGGHWRSREALHHVVGLIRSADADWVNSVVRVEWLEALFTDDRMPLRLIRRELSGISERDWSWPPRPWKWWSWKLPRWPASLLHQLRPSRSIQRTATSPARAPDNLRAHHHFMLHAHIEALEAKIPALDTAPIEVQAALAREVLLLDALKGPLPTDAQIARDQVAETLRIGFVASFGPQSCDGDGQLDWTVQAVALERLGETERNKRFQAQRKGRHVAERGKRMPSPVEMVAEFYNSGTPDISGLELAHEYMFGRAFCPFKATRSQWLGSDVGVLDPNNWHVTDRRVEDPENWRVISGISGERSLMTVANSEQDPIAIIPTREPIKIKVPKEIRKKIRDAINKTRPKFHRAGKVSFDRTSAGAYVVRDDDGTPQRRTYVVHDAHGTLELPTEKKVRPCGFYEKEKIPEYGTPLPCSKNNKQDAPERLGGAVKALKKELKGSNAIIVDTQNQRWIACDGRMNVRPRHNVDTSSKDMQSWGAGFFEPSYRTFKTASPVPVDPWGEPPRDPWAAIAG